MTQFRKCLTATLAVLVLVAPLTVRAQELVPPAPLSRSEESFLGNWVGSATVNGAPGTFALTLADNRQARVIFRDETGTVVATKDWTWSAVPGNRSEYSLSLGGQQGKAILVNPNRFRLQTKESGWVEFFRW